MGQRVTIDGRDVTDVIRSPEVGRAVSIVAANPEVRRQLVERQRAWADAHGGGVVEGRDIGSVVFPEAQVKVYLTAITRGAGPAAPRRGARRASPAATGSTRPGRRRRCARPRTPTGSIRPGARVQDVVEEVLSWL